MKKIILSLTTYGSRINTVHLTIESLLNQTKKADKIVLWLDEEEFSINTIPDNLENIINSNNVEISFCSNMKSYNKLIPSLIKYPNDIIITFDDDIIFDNKVVERLYSSYLESPHILHCMRAHFMTYTASGKLRSYNQWQREIRQTDPSIYIFPTTGAGVLFMKDYFFEDICKDEIFLKLAPTADDVWFKAMTMKKRIKCNVIATESDKGLTIIKGTQEKCLWNVNKHETLGNNPQIQAVFKKYNLLNPHVFNEKI